MAQSTTSGGIWEVNRKIKLAMPLQAEEVRDVLRTMGEVPGVKATTIAEGKPVIGVRYNAAEIDYNTVVSALKGCGVEPVINWWSNLKGNWYQFTDTNSRENANLPPPACCNKSPK